MKARLQDVVVCSMCQSPLDLEVLVTEGPEILEGILRCPCGMEYPVIGGVPRMLPRHLLSALSEDYPAFFHKYRSRLRPNRALERLESRVERRTQNAFGYEWTWASDYHAANFNDWLPVGFNPTLEFAGKTGLEVGCGAGRHAQLAAACAKEHVAVDVSRAVDPAFRRTRTLGNCHILQADVFHLPFRTEQFDYVYCLGVLQHFADPAAGFRALARQPRRGGLLLVNVYQDSRPAVQWLLESVRHVTTRIPHRLLQYLSIVAGCMDYGLFVGPWRQAKRTKLGRWLAPFVPGRVEAYAKYDFHTCVVDWFDRLSCPVKKHYSAEQLCAWYRDAGYSEVTVAPCWKAFWNACGRRMTDAPRGGLHARDATCQVGGVGS